MAGWIGLREQPNTRPWKRRDPQPSTKANFQPTCGPWAIGTTIYKGKGMLIFNGMKDYYRQYAWS